MASLKHILITGGGPAGCTLGILLVRKGFEVTLVHQPKRPELIVGESLVPSTIPVLRLLGIEEEVRSYSTFKPGATFYGRPEMPLRILFNQRGFFGGRGGGRLGTGEATYSYNVPRKDFDATFLNAARRGGVRVLECDAQFECGPGAGSISLKSETAEFLQSHGLGPIDFYVDATGRARTFSRLMDLGYRRGLRNDCVVFGHLDQCDIENEGHIHINRLSRGWSWRIPLPGRVSVGIVMPAQYWREFGASPAEQYDSFIKSEATLSRFTKHSQRVSPVAVYTNYQLITDNFYGPDWALVGDAAGFVDPIFSSGLDLSLHGAIRLASAIEPGIGSAQLSANLRFYEIKQREHIASWQQLVESFYDGRLFGLVRAASIMRSRGAWRFIVPTLERQVGRAIAGMMPFDTLSFKVCTRILKTGIGSKFGQRLSVQ